MVSVSFAELLVACLRDHVYQDEPYYLLKFSQLAGVPKLKLPVRAPVQDREEGANNSFPRRPGGQKPPTQGEAPPVPAKADGEYEAHLIALSRTGPPPGYSRWTTRLLADKSVELEYIGSISYSTVSRILKKRAQAPPERLLVHTPRAERRLRRGDGGRARGIQEAI